MVDDKLFNDLVKDVYEITNRPDLIAETESALKSATIKAHHSDYFSKDLHEEGFKFEEKKHRQSFDYIQAIDNFRAFKYVRISEGPCDSHFDAGDMIDIITPEEILDSYGTQRTNIAYVAGRVLEMRACVAFKYILLGCYVHPIVRKNAYCSWIALQYPNAIVYEAARIVFKAIGKSDESQQFSTLVGEEYSLLRLSNVQDVGY